MTSQNAPGTPDNPIPVTIEPVCGNCVHWIKNAGGEIGQGICVALPPGCSFKGNALIKTRPNMGANERGCTALFAARPEIVELAIAQQTGGVAPPDLVRP